MGPAAADASLHRFFSSARLTEAPPPAWIHLPHSQAPAWSPGAKKSGGDSKFVELLKYKTLRVGMKVLGVVTEVNDRGLTVSLPNGLKGTVTRAEASDVLAPVAKRKGGKKDAGDESEPESESESEE